MRIPVRTVVHHLRSLAVRESEAADDELLRRYLADADETAFAALVRRHAAMVLGVCRRILHHEQDAEDACQATFLVLARSAAAVRSRHSLAAWLHSVARRVSLKARTTRRPVVPLAAVDRPGVPMAEISWREGRAILDEELERLPESLRGPLVLCYLEGLTRDEAAVRLGCPLGTLKGRLERGRELLRCRLTRRGLAPSAVLAALALERVAVPAALAASVAGANVSARVRELADGLAPPSPLIAGRVALGLLLAGLVAGATALMLPANPEPPGDPPPAARTEKQVPKEDVKPRLDVHGDPLPEGAVARLGSLRLFHGHYGGRVVLSPDAKHVVCFAGGDAQGGINHLWDAVTGKELPLADELKRLFVFAADGKLLAANPQPGGRVVDLLTGKEVPADGIDVAAERARADAAAFNKPLHSPDGKLYADHDFKRIRVFDAATHKELPALPDQPDARPQSVTFSPDGKRLAAPYDDPVAGARVWDLTTHKLIARLPAKGAHVHHTAFSADGKTLAGSDGWGITLWDVASGKWLHDFGHTYYVDSLVFTPDGKTLVTGACYTDSTIRVWDALTGKERTRWRGHTDGIVGLAFLPDGRTVVSASEDQTVRLWEATTGKEVCRLARTPESLWALAVAPDGKTLATGGRAAVRLWDVATGKELRSFGENRTTRLAFSSDSKLLATVAQDARVVLLRDAATGREVRQLAGRRPIHTAPVFSPDGTIVSVGDSDGPIHLWEVATGREVRTLGDSIPRGPNGNSELLTITFSPDGRTLAAGHRDGCLRLWELASGRERTHFTEGHRSSVHKLAYSPDACLLASGSADRTVMVWDVLGRHTASPGRNIVPGAKDLLASWDTLASDDAGKAYRAVQELARAGPAAVPLLKGRLRPVAHADAEAARRLLKGLDSDDFATRREASEGLLRLGEAAEPLLKQALVGELSAEARRRVEAVIGQLDPAANPHRLRDLRAVEALEQSGTPEARRLLEELAAGAPPARLTRDAQAALRRLTK